MSPTAGCEGAAVASSAVTMSLAMDLQFATEPGGRWPYLGATLQPSDRLRFGS